MTTAVEVRGLHVHFPDAGADAGRNDGGAGVHALAGIDLSVPSGRFVGIVGPSGCGKSTLLKVLAGLVAPSAGTVEVDGASVEGRPGRVAFMPQRDLLLPWRRALDNAVLGAEVDGVGRDQARALAAPLFERFGLAGFERSWPHQLSGGMRQRLALLRTFVFRRSVLLLDEPFGALDAITRPELAGWLQGVWMADPRTVLLVTHDVEEALRLCDEVWVMSVRPGRLVTRVEVPWDRPRADDVVTRPEFVALRRTVLDALRAASEPLAP